MNGRPHSLAARVRAFRHAEAWLRSQEGERAWVAARLAAVLDVVPRGGAVLAALDLDGLGEFEDPRVKRDRLLADLFEMFSGGHCARATAIWRAAHRKGPIPAGAAPLLADLATNSGPGAKWPLSRSALVLEFQKLGVATGTRRDPGSG